MPKTTHLIDVYKGWGTYQRMLVDLVTPLTDAQLALPVSSAQWTVGVTLQHVIANRVWWFQIWMGQGDRALAPIASWDPAAPGETPTLGSRELVAGLNSTWHMISDALGRWTPDDLDHMHPPPPELTPEEKTMFGDISRQWIIWHVFEHEIHHGGEISLALGRHGLPGIYGDM